MSNSVWSAACNYPGSHWFTSYPARPDSPQIVYGHRYPGSDWTLVVPTQLYYISHTSPFIHCVLRLLLGKICKAVEFDPFQNKLRCTVLAALSSRSIQQLGGAMCWLDLSAHLAAHTHTMDLYSCALQWKLKKCAGVCPCDCAPCMSRCAFELKGYIKFPPDESEGLCKYTSVDAVCVWVCKKTRRMSIISLLKQRSVRVGWEKAGTCTSRRFLSHCESSRHNDSGV